MPSTPDTGETSQPPRLTITMIAAMDRHLVIGSRKGNIPWDLPRDRTHFRNYTEGKWMLVGRSTYQEMEGWFGDRTALILTRQASFQPFRESDRVVPSVEEAIALAEDADTGELIIGGGSKAYHSAYPLSNRLVLTHIEAVFEIEDPVRFPEFTDDETWKSIQTEDWRADGENHYSMRLEILER